MKNIIENLELIKIDKIKNTIIKKKTLLICNPSKIEDEFTLISKMPFEIMEKSVKSLLENDFKSEIFFEEIVKSIEIISKEIGKNCKGHKNYIKILKKKINLKAFFNHLNDSKGEEKNTNLKYYKFKFNKNNMRKLFTEFYINLKKKNFENFGFVLSKIFNITIEFSNIFNLNENKK